QPPGNCRGGVRPLHHSVRRNRLMRWGFSRCVITSLVLLGLADISRPEVAQAQTGTIGGRVTDAAAGTPIIGASVKVVGTQLGASTGNDGRYTIRTVPAGSVRIQINRIGYE